jgi:hypothetical protein
MSKKEEKSAWKRGEGWVQYNPPRYHPCYSEWIKLKQQKEKDDAG